MEQEQTTLRETLTDLTNKAESGEPIEVTPKETEVKPAEVKAEPDKPGRTAGRQRDEHGRLLPGKAVREEPQTQPEVQVEPPKPLQRPSSWKKEMWGHWDKLSSGQQLTPEEARAIAEYNISRESDFAKGVSTYKQEFERARPIMEALQPHIPMLQQHGIDPGQQIDRYMRIHQTLAMGSPEQKLALLMQVAQDYQIPVQNMFIRGQDGQVYFNEQLRPQAPQLNQPRQPDINALVEQKFAEREVSQAIKDFTSAKDASGNPKYPHYETVRETMAQLLENGSVDDLEQAYQYALRHPRHSDIYEAEQQQLAQKNEAEKQRQLKEAAERARRNNISVKSGAPASQGGQAQKGLRAQLSSAWDEHLGGRV